MSETLAFGLFGCFCVVAFVAARMLDERERRAAADAPPSAPAGARSSAPTAAPVPKRSGTKIDALDEVSESRARP